MTPATKGRLIATIALPFLLLHVFPGHAWAPGPAWDAVPATK